MENQSTTFDFTRRTELTELMDAPCSRDVLRACLQDIARTNRLTFAYRPLLGWLSRLTADLPPLAAPLRILDIGCGYGDGLRRIERWARRRRIPVELVGLDLNPDATALAEEATAPSSRIQWVTADVLSYTPPQAPHLIVSSLFTHHLNEEQIVQFLRWMEDHARLGWFINDLSRVSDSLPLFQSLRPRCAPPSLCAERRTCLHCTFIHCGRVAHHVRRGRTRYGEHGNLRVQTRPPLRFAQKAVGF